MKKLVLLLIFSVLFLLSACSAVEADPEADSTETSSPSAEQTVVAATETFSPADSDATEMEESANPVEAEDMTNSEDTAESEEDEYGIMTLPLYIGLSVTDLTDSVATIQIDNRSGYEIEYDLFFNLEREVQPDEWERLESTEDIPTGDAVYSLPDLQQVTVLCDLNPYGALPDGHYRIEKDDLYAEFTLQDGALAED